MSPQQANYSAHSTVEKIKKKQRWDDEGVSATIGTIMTLLVFLTFLGMFTNQVLPVMMNDNESTHMAEAIGQFTTLKSSIDISISNYANALIAPSTIFVPVTLSAPGIPVFAASTAGVLSMLPRVTNEQPSFNGPMFNVSYTYKSVSGGTTVIDYLNSTNDGAAGGLLQLLCPNRYYVGETLIYENGAVILNQSDGEFVLAGPQFMVKNVGTGATRSLVVMFTQVSILGNSKTIGGTGSKGVNANLQFADTSEYDSPYAGGSYLNFTIVTQHGVAWASYFKSMLNGTAGMSPGHGFNITTVQPTGNKNYYTVTVSIQNIKVLDYTLANVNMNIGELTKQ